jgi:hypothetical protein
MVSRALLAACILLGLLVPVEGQGIGRGRTARPPKVLKPETEPFVAEGTVRAIMPGRIQMLSDSGQNWTVAVDPKAVVHVTGTAEPDFLRPGLFIRFKAEIDQRGTAKEKLRELTIFRPSREDLPGIRPEGEGGAGDKPAEGERRFGALPPEGRRKRPSERTRGAARGSIPTSGVYSVAGRITSSRNGTLTVSAGRAAVRVELAEDAKIDVDTADYSLAKQGDRISVTKGKMFAGRIGLAQAQELTIKLSEPLTLNKKKPARSKSPAARRPPSRRKKADSQQEPLGETN